ncbi:hypothetical protein [Streptomyces subrutilus]|uniref:hypothetical protein n=1 Tax=Streptomyces subrutilus TaxID=36818 RepID=UPI00340359DE
MPIPGTIPTVKVRGTYFGPDGRSLLGSITFTIPALLTFPDSDLFIAGPVVAQLDENGRFEVTLPATDAPGMNPSGWSYTVKENLTGVVGTRSYAMILPKDTPGGVIDLADIAPADPTTPNYVPVPGSQILTGTGTPAASLGVNGDFYVQYDTRTLLGITHTTVTNWKKANGAWAKAGADIHGSQIFLNNTGTPSADAKPGDLLIRTDTGDLYQREASAWGSVKGNIKGPKGDKGDAGTRGSKVYEGPVGEIAGLLDGDVSIVPGTGVLYWREGGAWVTKGNIRGPQGIQGIQGPKGDPGLGNVNSVNTKLGPDVVLNAADVGALALNGTTSNVVATFRGNGTNAPLNVYGDGTNATRFTVLKDGSWYSNAPANTAYNMGVGDTTTDFGGGNFVLAIKNANTVPATNPTNGVVLYSEAQTLKVLSGTSRFSLVEPVPLAQRAAANGVATLDSTTKIPVAQMPETSVFKSADTIRFSTTTHSDDPHLTIPVVANARYVVDAVLVWTTGGGGFNVSWGHPANGTAMAWTDNDGAGMGSISTSSGFSSTTGTSLRGLLRVGTVAGNLTIRWAQNASNVGNTVLLTGSYLGLRRVA